MATDTRSSTAEEFLEQRVRYSIDFGGRLVVIENVPARVSRQTGEHLFSPETTARIHEIVRSGKPPARVVEADVYDYS
jgi:YgiT-type zinc finger domain-containing protein